MKSTIKELLLKHGFRTEDCEDDFRLEVYQIAEAMLREGQQSIVQANVDLVIQEQEKSQIAMYKATQRQHIATACLQGMLASESHEFCYGSADDMADIAVLHADALIKKLDKEQEDV